MEFYLGALVLSVYVAVLVVIHSTKLADGWVYARCWYYGREHGVLKRVTWFTYHRPRWALSMSEAEWRKHPCYATRPRWEWLEEEVLKPDQWRPAVLDPTWREPMTVIKLKINAANPRWTRVPLDEHEITFAPKERDDER